MSKQTEGLAAWNEVMSDLNMELLNLVNVLNRVHKALSEAKGEDYWQFVHVKLAEQPAPAAQQEPTKAAELVDALIAKYSDKLYDSSGPHDAAKFEEDCNHIKQTLAEQPAPDPTLTNSESRAELVLAESVAAIEQIERKGEWITREEAIAAITGIK